MRRIITMASLLAVPAILSADGAIKNVQRPWRSLPLIKDGRLDPNWVHIGWGSFSVDNGSLRTDCDEKGMGLLLYKTERFGDCQIRVVYRSKDARSNSGVFVRIDDGVIQSVNDKPEPIRRGDKGSLSDDSVKQLMAASQNDRGPWYAVHHGYEVQICDEADEVHRTGAIYSLATAAALPEKPAGEWRTMVITLKGNLISVEVDGKHVTTFDPESKGIRKERKWYEPKREPKRPQKGYIGLQNHDPGDVVHFKEVSVRPLSVE
jgi:hypothetical protein